MEPELIGPEDASVEHPSSRFSEQVLRTDVELAAALDEPLDESHLREHIEHSTRFAGESNAASASNR